MANEGNRGSRPSDRPSQFTKYTDNLEVDRDDDDTEDLFDDADDPLDPSFLQLLEEADRSESSGPDLYAVLGVEKTATMTELRAAYRRLSLLLHPDRHSKMDSSSEDNPADARRFSGDADSAFNRVSTAYAILSDPSKRRIYDAYGHDGELGVVFCFGSFFLYGFFLRVLLFYFVCCNSLDNNYFKLTST